MKDIDANAQDGHQSTRDRFRVHVVDMAVKTSVEYISASANRFNGTAAVSSSSLVAFGSGKLVALWDAQVGSPLRSLPASINSLDSHPTTTVSSRPCQDMTGL